MRLNFFQNYFDVLIIMFISNLENSASYSQFFFKRAQVLLASLIQCQPTEVLQVLGEGRTEENKLERKYSHVESDQQRDQRVTPAPASHGGGEGRRKRDHG